MKFLLSCGFKTDNIREAVRPSFESSGDEFVIVPYIEDIQDIFSRGEYFDKALIAEQSITRDSKITDMTELRTRVNDFSTMLASRCGSEKVVFLTQYMKIASLIKDETFDISERSAIILKGPKYYVSFFESLLTNDIDKLPKEIVYTDDMLDSDIKDNNADVNENTEHIEEKGNDTKYEVSANEDIMDSLGFDEDDTLVSGVSDSDNNTEQYEFEDENEEQYGFEEDEDSSTNEQYEFEETANDDNNEQYAFDDTDDSEYGFEDVDNTADEQYEFDDSSDNSNDSNSTIFDEDTDISNVNSIDSNDSFEFNEVESNSNTEDNETYEFEDTLENNLDENSEDNDDDIFSGFDTITELGNELGDVNSNDSNSFDDTFDINENNIGLGNIDDSTIDTSNTDTFEEETATFDEDTDENKETASTGNEINEDSEFEFEEENTSGEELGFSNGNNVDEYEFESDTNDAFSSDEEVLTNNELFSGLQTYDNADETDAEFNRMENLNNTEDNIEYTEEETKRSRIRGRKKEKQLYTVDADWVGQLKDDITAFANRGNSIAVTGCGGCGTSFIAYNLARTVADLGYTVLLIDADTVNKTQSYITKDNYMCMNPEGTNLMEAVNSSSGISNYIAVANEGLNILTMGLAADKASVEDVIQKNKVARFINLIKSSYNFVVWDLPFDVGTSYLQDVIYNSDNVVLTIDASTWGITKALTSMCNIESEDMENTMFSRAQIVFNKYRNLNRYMGKKVTSAREILSAMDNEVHELTQQDIGYYFSEMNVSGVIADDANIEDMWYTSKSYVNTKKGQRIFGELLRDIVLNK